MSELEQAKDFLMQYKGKIQERENEITIKNKNILIDHEGKEHRVDCEITIEIDNEDENGRYTLWYEEKTLEILGGGIAGYKTMAEALKIAEEKMERYRFERKGLEQTSLF